MVFTKFSNVGKFTIICYRRVIVIFRYEFIFLFSFDGRYVWNVIIFVNDDTSPMLK